MNKGGQSNKAPRSQKPSSPDKHKHNDSSATDSSAHNASTPAASASGTGGGQHEGGKQTHQKKKKQNHQNSKQSSHHKKNNTNTTGPTAASSHSSNAKQKAAAAAKEERRKRQEEEEEAARVKEEAERQELEESAKRQIEQLQAIAAARKKQWNSMDPKNVSKIRSKAKSQMKSDVKKSLALVKRIGSMSTSIDKIQSLLKDIASINLNRYSSEIAVALVDPRMRPADVPVVAAIAGAMHQRYPGFLPTMLKYLFDSFKTSLATMLSSSTSSQQNSSNNLPSEANSILQQTSEVLKQAKNRVEQIASKDNDIDTLAADDLGMGLGDLGDMGMDSGASLSGNAKRSSSSSKEGSTDSKTGEMSPKAALNRCRALLILLTELYLCGVWRDNTSLHDIFLAIIADKTDRECEGGEKPIKESKRAIEPEEDEATHTNGDTPSEQSNVVPNTATTNSIFLDAVDTREVDVESVPKKSHKRSALVLPLIVHVLKHVSYGHVIDFDNDSTLGDDAGKFGSKEEGIPLSQYLLGRLPRQSRTYLSQLPLHLVKQWPFIGCSTLYPYTEDLRNLYEDKQAIDSNVHLVFTCLSTGEQRDLSSSLFTLFCHASAALQHEYLTVCKLEKKNRDIEFNRGEVTEKAVQNLANAKQYFEKLSSTVYSLRDTLDCIAPSLKEPEPDTQSNDQGEITLWDGSWEGAVSLGPFDDESMRSFYLDVPNLRDTIPSILLDTPEEAAAKAAERDQRSKQGNTSNAAVISPVVVSTEPSLAEAASKFKNPRGQRGTLDTALKQFVPGVKGSSAATDATAVPTSACDSKTDKDHQDTQNRELHRPRGTSEASESSENEEEDDNQELLDQDFMQDDILENAEEAKEQLSRSESLDDYDDEAGWGSKESFDRLLQELSHCVSKDLIDNWAHEFVVQKHFNKLGRRLVLKHIAYANPASTDMFPYYGRLVATFEKASPGFSKPLLATLEDDLKYMTKKKRNSHLDLKLRNGRLVAEFCKFGVAPPNMVFRILSRCIRDFSSHSIEVLACILEGCGKYLYMLSQTRARLQQVLDTMQKLKKAKGLDGIRASLIDNAYYACVPVTGNHRPKKKDRPFLYEFLRYLVLEKLGKLNTTEVVKILRRLPWTSEPMVPIWLRKSVFRSIQTSSATGSRLVSVLSSLKTFKESVVMYILDHAMSVIEDGLLVSNTEDFRYTQKRMAVCHFIGDAFNAKLVDNKMLLRLLYAVTNIGHALPRPSDAISSIKGFAASEEIRKQRGPQANITMEDIQAVDLSSVFPHPLVEPDPRVPQIGTWGFHPLVPCESDKPNDVHRIHIVCEILQNCATPLTKGVARQKVDDFLCCFERYVLSKERLPVETDSLVAETMELLRPNRKRFKNFQEAQMACAKLELTQCKELAAQAYANRHKSPQESTVADDDDDDALNDGESSEEEEHETGEQMDNNDIENANVGEEPTDEEMEEEGEELEREREPKHKSEADIEFESQLAELEKESIEQRKLAGVRVTADHMALPIQLKRQQKQEQERQRDYPSGKIPFTLLRRKGASRSTGQNVGSKVETSTLFVPENVPLAARSTESVEAARREKEELKRVTLAMQDRQEFEERKQTVDVPGKKFGGGDDLEDVPEAEEDEEEVAEDTAVSGSGRGRGRRRGQSNRGRGSRGRGRGRGGFRGRGKSSH